MSNYNGENIQMIDDKHDLIFSPDDEDSEGRGWYIQKSFPPPVWSKTSQLFKNKESAINAMKEGRLIFD